MEPSNLILMALLLALKKLVQWVGLLKNMMVIFVIGTKLMGQASIMVVGREALRNEL